MIGGLRAMLKFICPNCQFSRELSKYYVEELGFKDVTCYCGFKMEHVEEVEQ